MQVGTTKDQGLYNKSSAAVHPGALTAGALAQYNTMGPVGASASNRNEYQGYLPGVKAAGALGLQPCHLHVSVV